MSIYIKKMLPLFENYTSTTTTAMAPPLTNISDYTLLTAPPAAASTISENGLITENEFQKSDNVLTNIKRKALNDGKLFTISAHTPINKFNFCTERNFNLPSEQCGFKRTFESKVPLRCVIDVDSRAVVSLALVNKQSMLLQSYANKLPIMSLNVSRLLYTTEAFALQDTNDGDDDMSSKITSPAQKALEFYITTDLKYRNRKNAPNEQFSKYLHRLASNGYIEYIFDLARHLHLNVDLVLNQSVVCRYKKTNDRNININSSRGYLTVIHNADRWYVKTTITPLATPDI
ncbi:putative gp84-like protein [Esparto virus]|uniref:Putative gp84-like protein n=1 Tax=Esparto virus TaxID=2072209 RepID=A0A2I7G2Y1_9VIRU|nr:putative gp84-like protein [Esparto virus]AUQ44000.1 putative gp84-like protein [Esparto virus]